MEQPQEEEGTSDFATFFYFTALMLMPIQKVPTTILQCQMVRLQEKISSKKRKKIVTTTFRCQKAHLRRNLVIVSPPHNIGLR